MGDPKHGDIAATCVAYYAKDLSTRLVADARFPRGVRPYTVREYARLQEFARFVHICWQRHACLSRCRWANGSGRRLDVIFAEHWQN
jgi:hypothetical protein